MSNYLSQANIFMKISLRTMCTSILTIFLSTKLLKIAYFNAIFIFIALLMK